MSLAEPPAKRALRAFVVRVWAAALAVAVLPPPAAADIPLLRDIIIETNRRALDRKLKDGSYRGEEGILMVRPERARQLGIAALILPEYVEAVALYEQADRFFRNALNALAPAREDACSESRIDRAASYAARYHGAVREAGEKMRRYHERVAAEGDERLSRDRCSGIMDRLLAEALAEASRNLREALGGFSNACRGVTRDRPLGADNIVFVNRVFRAYTERAGRDALGSLDLDRHRRNGEPRTEEAWKTVLEGPEAAFVPLLESVLDDQRTSGGYWVDPLLFMALIRQESNFKADGVSIMGAAGLTQIMPATGRGLGMKDIYAPAYFREARAHLIEDRSSRREAKTLLRGIRQADLLEPARRACTLLQKARSSKSKWVALYRRYQRELAAYGKDDRLDPAKSIRYGYAYFSEQLRRHGGDMSLALAAYNAGPHRVEQYKGIPPFTETVDYRNRVLGHYREYLRRLESVLEAADAERCTGAEELRSGGG